MWSKPCNFGGTTNPDPQYVHISCFFDTNETRRTDMGVPSHFLRCLSLRVENRLSVLGIFLYVPWGGVWWGNNVHVLAHSHDVTPRHVHLHVRTYVMLRWRCVTSRRGWVGWGGVITFTYLRTPMMLRHGTFTCTCAHTSCYVEDVSRHAGVGWGGVITLTSCPENE